jgi:hypothetical protein
VAVVRSAGILRVVVVREESRREVGGLRVAVVRAGSQVVVVREGARRGAGLREEVVI